MKKGWWKWRKAPSTIKEPEPTLSPAELEAELAHTEAVLEDLDTTHKMLLLQTARQGEAIKLLVNWAQPRASALEMATLNKQLVELWQDKALDPNEADLIELEEMNNGNEVIPERGV